MGQTCTTVQLQTNRANLGIQDPLQQKTSQKKNHVQDYLSKQKKKIKSITLIENSSQLIYQYNDMRETVEKLTVNNWQNSQLYEQLTIQDFINQTTFVVRTKLVDNPNPVWKVISSIKVENISSQGLMDVGLFYYNFSRIQKLHQISESFVYAENCWVQFQEGKKNKGIFIIESQPFQEDIVGLRQLGKFMKQSDICWQDREFVDIILNCCRQVEIMHENNFMVIEEFLIGESGHIHCIGGLVQENSQFSQNLSDDYYTLAVYLVETLYGESFQLSSAKELQRVIYQEEQTCTFKHPQSISLLVNLLRLRSAIRGNLPTVQSQTFNIPSYVKSYRVKIAVQSSVMLADRYVELKEYFKAKEVLFERLSLLMYRQKGHLNQQSVRSDVFNKLMKKLNITKSQFEECFDVLELIIKLQRKIAAQINKSNELESFIKEYINLGLLLSLNCRKQENFVKSLSILQRVQEFLGQDNESWVLNLHLAECYLFTGRLDDAENHYKTSIKYEINEANVCFLIRFYATVLNWQKAISLLRSYEGLIVQDYLYDLLISRILLSKALCVSPESVHNKDQRTQTFYECLQIAKRIFDRKGMAELVLCESYELIGDGNFYIKDNERAFEAYEKGLALARSIDYSAKKTETDQEEQKYEASYLQRNQQGYSRSMTPHTVQNSIYKRSISQKSGGNQTIMSIRSLVSQTEQKQSSFIHQLRFLHNFDKKAILLSSMANCRFMQRKYSQAIDFYQQARNSVLSHNVDLKNSIMGNMAICCIEMGKSDRSQGNKSKIEEGKSLLQHIMNVTKKQNPSKLQNDVNYLFLLNELQAL